MVTDPKKTAAAILSKRKHSTPNQVQEKVQEVEYESDPLDMAAEDIMDAIHSKDLKRMKHAMRAFMQIESMTSSDDDLD